MEKTYQLEFKGYRLQGSEATLEEISGIYCVYAAIYNKERDTVTLNRCLYIGRAENIRRRMMDHRNDGDFLNLLRPGEILCYSRAPLPAEELVRCEAALIYEHDFGGNEQSTKEFHHDATRVITTGRNEFLHGDFTVRRTVE